MRFNQRTAPPGPCAPPPLTTPLTESPAIDLLCATAVLAASVLSFITIPLFGHISDRIGRKKTYMIGAALTGVFGYGEDAPNQPPPGVRTVTVSFGRSIVRPFGAR